MQKEVSEYHFNHIEEINKLKEVKGEGIILTKEAVTRLLNLEAKHASYKAAQLEMCYLCESIN